MIFVIYLQVESAQLISIRVAVFALCIECWLVCGFYVHDPTHYNSSTPLDPLHHNPNGSQGHSRKSRKYYKNSQQHYEFYPLTEESWSKPRSEKIMQQWVLKNKPITPIQPLPTITPTKIDK